MDYRLPYYMAYPMPIRYDDERLERRDFEYMKSMYPMTVKRVLPFVEEECDRMSYESSMIYDEYPDRLQIYLMCKRIYDKVIQADGSKERDIDQNLMDLIHLAMAQELYRRRCNRRRKGYQIYEKK